MLASLTSRTRPLALEGPTNLPRPRHENAESPIHIQMRRTKTHCPPRLPPNADEPRSRAAAVNGSVGTAARILRLLAQKHVAKLDDAKKRPRRTLRIVTISKYSINHAVTGSRFSYLHRIVDDKLKQLGKYIMRVRDMFPDWKAILDDGLEMEYDLKKPEEEQIYTYTET